MKIELIGSKFGFRAVFDSISDAIFIIDAATFRIIDVNARTCELFGYSLEEILKLNLGEISEGNEPYSQSDAESWVKNAKGGKNQLFEWLSRKKDNSIFWSEINICYRNIHNSDLVFVTLRDISERKIIQTRFQKEADFNQSLIQSLPAYLVLISPTGETLYMNKSLLDCLGYSQDEVIGADYVSTFVPEIDRNSLKSIFLKIVENKEKTINVNAILKKDGQHIFVKWHGCPIFDEKGEMDFFFGIGTDLTEHLLAEKTIKESEERYRLLSDLTFEGILIHDNGIALDVNLSFCRLFGYEKEEIVGKNIIEIVVDEEYKKLCYKKIFGKSTQPYEMKCVKKNYEKFWVKVIGKQIIYEGKEARAAALRDISERKKAEENYLLSETKYKELFNDAPVGYHELNAEGKIVRINKTELEMLGYTEDEMLNHYMWEFVVEGDLGKRTIIAKLGGNMVTGKPFERSFLKKDGSYISVLLDDKLLFNNEGKTIGLRATVQDISERKRNELALIESNRRLEEALSELKNTQKQVIQQERLRSLGQMASGIAHDINNALTPILGYAELLLKAKDPAKNLERTLNKIKTSTLDIKNTIERLKEFYRPKSGEGEFSKVDLNSVIQSTIELTRHRWKDIAESKGIVIKIQASLDKEISYIKGNESEIREGLTNLILNACDAMPEGGVLYIRSYMTVNLIQVEVQDTGIGMDEETLNRCFDPFFTTKGEKGTGLGLSMVYGTMQRHSGQIETYSEKGKGTLIKLIFMANPESDNSGNEDTPALLPKLRILCIDDVKDVCNLVFMMLNEHQHLVKIAYSGKEGLEKFFKYSDKNQPFDVVITDLGMPYMDGISVAEAVKSKYPDTPVILMTGWGAFITEETLKSINYVLRKPITFDELQKALKSVIRN